MSKPKNPNHDIGQNGYDCGQCGGQCDGCRETQRRHEQMEAASLGDPYCIPIDMPRISWITLLIASMAVIGLVGWMS